MIVVCLEPEAVGNGTMNGGALVVHRAVRGAVVDSEGGDVDVEGGVGPGGYDGTGDDPLQNPARFLWATASSVKEDVSSIVSLQACLTGLTTLFR